MTIGIVAKLKVAPGKNAEFEEIFSVLARATRKDEPGNNFYALHKSKTDPQLYVVLENYKDAAAFAAAIKAAELGVTVAITATRSAVASNQYREQMVPSSWGNLQIRHFNKVITSYIDGHVEGNTLEQLRDIRRWNPKAN